jgi:hypothetical protein
MKLNREIHYYSTRELDEVLGTLNDDTSMRKVITEAKRKRVQFSTESIRQIGKELYVESAAIAVLGALEKNREKKNVTVANDDDVLTVGQLRAALKETVRGFAQGSWVTEGSSDDFVDQVMQRVNHPWDQGDIVEDAIGNWYKRTAFNSWMSFGNSGYHADSTPVRPLRKIN